MLQSVKQWLLGERGRRKQKGSFVSNVGQKAAARG